ncbi:MAG: hypothetical protein BWY99_02175 [Synergistetes bacterium ADurb.BinA166]|nr:MAG: hypothetical protein BWY99_02175 [Synergistetes bacterium ADurb.BinA166]
MKDIGPDVYEPAERRSYDERRLERFAPEPDPPRKIVSSASWNLMMSSRESSTDEMKHAEAAWARPWIPRLNQTGELNAPYWWTRAYRSSSR